MKTQTADVMSQGMVLMPLMKTRRGTTKEANKQTLAQGGSESFTANHSGGHHHRENVFHAQQVPKDGGTKLSTIDQPERHMLALLDKGEHKVAVTQKGEKQETTASRKKD
jgi:hypothetical protein